MEEGFDTRIISMAGKPVEKKKVKVRANYTVLDGCEWSRHNVEGKEVEVEVDSLEEKVLEKAICDKLNEHYNQWMDEVESSSLRYEILEVK